MSQTFAQLINGKSATVEFSAGSASTPAVSFSGDTNTGIYSPGADQVAISTNGTGRLFVDSSGRVGIGASPQSELQVNASDTISVIQITNSTTGATNTDGLWLYNNGADATLSNLETGFLRFETAGTERLRLTSTGLLGLGTSSPQAILDVAPDANRNLLVQGKAATTYGLELKNGSANSAGEFHVTAASSGSVVINRGSTEIARFNSTGLGIGTSSPSALIHAVGTSANLILDRTGDNPAIILRANGTNSAGVSTELNTLRFETGSGLTERMRIDSSGRVGIGTTSPAALLHLLTSSSGECFRAANGSDAARLHFYTANTGSQLQSQNSNLLLNAYDNYSLVLATNNSERARIDTSGRLLVGTSTSFNTFALLQVYKSSGDLHSVVNSASLSNGTSVLHRVQGGVASGDFGVYKHSGIAGPCVFIDLQAQDGASNYYWTDNSDILRTSTNAANIGTTGGTVVGTQTSDERIKNILGPVKYGLDTLKQIEPVRFSLKSEPETERLGFIAQQVQPLVPQSVFDTKEHIEGEPEDAPTKLGMEYVALIPILVNAIKELSAEVDTLKAQLA